ncbi:MAG: cytochrome C oxidase subunit IV family protein [Planctomycetota bacterium]|nr:cytochrome C oxidase subunit IV family protein [Planctomycetota bacterium]
MAEAQTATDTPLDKVKVLISKFEDEHHHPRSGRLWWVLLIFTLMEIGWASSLLGLTDRSMEPLQLAKPQNLCQTILAEKDKDTIIQGNLDAISDAQYARQEAVLRAIDLAPAMSGHFAPDAAKLLKEVREGKDRLSKASNLQAGANAALAAYTAELNKKGNEEAKAKAAASVANAQKALGKINSLSAAKVPVFQPHQLVMTGRPGKRIYTLMSEAERALVVEFATGAVGEDKLPELAEAFNTVLNKEEVSAKLAGLRTTSGVNKSFFAFMGEADVVMLNRGLLEKAYPTQITPPSIPFLLILGLVGFAVLKMILVAEFFMHVKYESVWIRMLMLPTGVLAFVVVAFLAPDVGRVHMTTWSYQFLAPMFIFIVAGIFVVRFLSGYMDIPKDESEPAHH